jgi:phosphate/sulfate permease
LRKPPTADRTPRAPTLQQLLPTTQVYNSGTIPADGIPDIPIWALAMGSAGFVVGIVALGSRTIATVGSKITQLTPTRSFATQIGAAIAVLLSSVLGLPVSTSHCLVGAVIGIGIAQSLSGVTAPLSWSVLKRIALSWVVTIPMAMILALVLYYPFQSLYQ